MDLRKVKKLIELFEESTLSEMEISEGDATIRMARGQVVSQSIPINPSVGVMEQVQVNDSTPESAPQQPSVSIDSPMVGTFYSAASADADPYVLVGSQVSPGDVLCIIEAMKTFNQLQCEVSGTIRKILKSNGDPVEYGESIFLIE